jgi:curli production assembly/transport component CsgG
MIKNYGTYILLAFLVVVLGGCATGSAIREKLTGNQFDEPTVESSKYLIKKENELRPPAGGPVPVAVYGFTDKTGQRKALANIASLSSAVTQGAESYLIKALQDVGGQRWFTVLERVGLDNLIKERQMIRQMREQYQGKEAKALPPMLFAGIIMEGGIVGYDSNTLTGGHGMRIFGIGASTQYQSDTVTVTLRTVSVSTGEILTSVTITKTVLSYMDKLTVLRFVDDPTNSLTGTNALGLEGEFGGSINESINKAIDVAVQAAVLTTIKEGARKGVWAFQEERPVVQMPPIPAHIEKPVTISKSGDVPVLKTEEKKEEVIQPQIIPEVKAEPSPPSEVTPENLLSHRTLKDGSFLYADPTMGSTKKWWFAKGTKVSVRRFNDDGWARVIVVDGSDRGGWIAVDKLEQLVDSMK